MSTEDRLAAPTSPPVVSAIRPRYGDWSYTECAQFLVFTLGRDIRKIPSTPSRGQDLGSSRSGDRNISISLILDRDLLKDGYCQ